MSKRIATSPLGGKEFKKQKITLIRDRTDNGFTDVGDLLPLSPLSDAPSDMDLDGGHFSTPATPKKQPKKITAAPIAATFEPWTPPHPEIPRKTEDHWGIKPTMKNDAVGVDNKKPCRVPFPMPQLIQPSARSSNGATNPPLWEDQGARFQRGSRYVKPTSATEAEDVDGSSADIDQEELLHIRLLDMRPTSRSNPAPRRKPITYHYGDDFRDENGAKGNLGRKPKDWNDQQAIKGLNDRRAQAIARITQDDHWTSSEREYLATLFRESPNASIWEMTARHNDRFMNKDFTHGTGFASYDRLSTGRTIESVRQQYLSYKAAYDGGAAPAHVRWASDNSPFAQAMQKKWVAALPSGNTGARKGFGTPDKALKSIYDDPVYQGEETVLEAKTAPKKYRSAKGKLAVVTQQPQQPLGVPVVEETQAERTLGEELLLLAGYYEDQSDAESPVSDTKAPTIPSSPFPFLSPTNVASRTVSVGTMTIALNATSTASSASPIASPDRSPAKHASTRTASEIFQARMKLVDEEYGEL